MTKWKRRNENDDIKMTKHNCKRGIQKDKY